MSVCGCVSVCVFLFEIAHCLISQSLDLKAEAKKKVIVIIIVIITIAIVSSNKVNRTVIFETTFSKTVEKFRR